MKMFCVNWDVTGTCNAACAAAGGSCGNVLAGAGACSCENIAACNKAQVSYCTGDCDYYNCACFCNWP